MHKFIVCLLLVALLGMISPLLSAQQNQNTQKANTEIEEFKKQISEIKEQLQLVENVEKMDLQAKLAEANAKLADAEFGKFERQLRDSNSEWLRNWSIILLAFLSVVGIGVWSWLKSRTNELIETEVEKNLNGFKEAVKVQEEIKYRLGTLERQYVATVLESVIHHVLLEEHHHPEPIKALREKVLLQAFDDDKIYYPLLVYKAAEVLAARKSPRLISPLLGRLNLEADLESDPRDYYNVAISERPAPWPDAVKFLAYIHTSEAYEGLKRFLNYLLTENPKSKNWFIEKAVFSLVQVGIRLNEEDSFPILRRAISHLDNPSHEVLNVLVEYFDSFNESAGIKEILKSFLYDETTHMTLPHQQLANKCLELLQKHDPDFVEEWRARETTDNSEA